MATASRAKRDPFLTMPQEVLDTIFSYLEDKPLRNARLTCHRFSSTGIRRLTVSELPLSKFVYDLDRLNEVSQHPKFSQDVTTLRCDDSNFSDEEMSMAETMKAKSMETGSTTVTPTSHVTT